MNSNMRYWLLAGIVLLVTRADPVFAQSSSTADGASSAAAGSTTAGGLQFAFLFSNVTTPPPPPECQCLGDDDLLANNANTLKVLEMCRQRYSYERLFGVDAGYSPNKVRCGSRNAADAVADTEAYCNCSKKGERVQFSHWVNFKLEDSDGMHRWETYMEGETNNTLLMAKSQGFIKLKLKLEKIFDEGLAGNADAVAKGFVKVVVMNFTKGAGCINCPTTTTTTTLAPSTTTVTGGSSSTGEARKKRQAGATTTTTTTTTTIIYDSHYVTVNLEVQFMKEVTEAEFKTLWEAMLAAAGTSAGLVSDAVLVTYPAKTVCPNANLTDLMPSTMEEMDHDKEIHLVNITETLDNGTEVWTGNVIDDNYLTAGEEVNIFCKDRKMVPSRDEYDFDPYDKNITAVCEPDQSYSVRVTQLAVCVTVCSQQNEIPQPHPSSLLYLQGVIKAGERKMTPLENIHPKAYIRDEDRLVYRCKEERHGLNGGVDSVLDVFMCTNTSKYNTPPIDYWPKCSKQDYMVIKAAEKVLFEAYQYIENKYKVIGYKEEDANKIKVLNDYMIQYTLPTVIVMCVLFVLTLLCSRNDSPICNICASKSESDGKDYTVN